MELDANKLMLDAVKDGLRDGLRNRFTSSYNNPLDALLNGASSGAWPRTQEADRRRHRRLFGRRTVPGEHR
jgi:hypothetical protein